MKTPVHWLPPGVGFTQNLFPFPRTGNLKKSLGPTQFLYSKFHGLLKLIQGDFFNWASPENVSRLAPPKFAWTGPPLNCLSVGIIFTSPDTQTFFDHEGLTFFFFFLNQILTGQLDFVYIFDGFYFASLFPDGKQALSKFINCNFHRDF